LFVVSEAQTMQPGRDVHWRSFGILRVCGALDLYFSSKVTGSLDRIDSNRTP
jgi:hypothetical protein